MFQRITAWLFNLLLDQRGEGEGEGAAGSGEGAPAGGGEGASPAGEGGEGEGGAPAGEGEGEGAGEGGEGAAQPKYGEFGDAPTVDQVFEALTALQGDHGTLSDKTTQTETNLSNLRKNLKSKGIMVADDGTLSFQEKKPDRKTRFTDDHSKLFEPKVMEALQFMIQDAMDTGFESYDSRSTERQTWATTVTESLAEMFAMYPDLRAKLPNGTPNPTFNKAHFDRASQLLDEKYRNLADGDLISAIRAASELSISPVAVAAAAKKGYEKGKAGKKILGAARGGAAGKAGGKRLSKEEYLKLSPDEKDVYDEKTKDMKA